jgi:hypothetical protein
MTTETGGTGGTPATPTAGSGTTPPPAGKCDTSGFMTCKTAASNWGTPQQEGPCMTGETIYGVKVRKVRTMTVPGKLKRRGMSVGKKPNWKKALVTLKKGDVIDFFATE